jgi:hypothetical protein
MNTARSSDRSRPFRSELVLQPEMNVPIWFRETRGVRAGDSVAWLLGFRGLACFAECRGIRGTAPRSHRFSHPFTAGGWRGPAAGLLWTSGEHERSARELQTHRTAAGAQLIRPVSDRFSRELKRSIPESRIHTEPARLPVPVTVTGTSNRAGASMIPECAAPRAPRPEQSRKKPDTLMGAPAQQPM